MNFFETSVYKYSDNAFLIAFYILFYVTQNNFSVFFSRSHFR